MELMETNAKLLQAAIDGSPPLNLLEKRIILRPEAFRVCLGGWVFDKCFPPNSLLLGVFNSFLRCVRPLFHCWCPPFSAGHLAFLFICLPDLSLLVSAHFCSFVSQVCHCCCPPCLVVTVSVCVRRVSLFSFCLPSCLLSLCPRCLPSVSGLVSLLGGHCLHLVSLLFPFVSLLLVTVSVLSPFLSPFLLVIVSVLSLFCFLLSPFLLVIVSILSPFLLVIVPALSPSCLLLCPFLFPVLLVTVSTLSPFCFLLFLLFHARMSNTCLTYLPFGSRKTRCDLLVVLGRLPVTTGYQPYRHKCGTCFLLAVVSPHHR